MQSTGNLLSACMPTMCLHAYWVPACHRTVSGSVGTGFVPAWLLTIPMSPDIPLTGLFLLFILRLNKRFLCNYQKQQVIIKKNVAFALSNDPSFFSFLSPPFWTGSHSASQSDRDLTIFLPRSPSTRITGRLCPTLFYTPSQFRIQAFPQWAALVKSWNLGPQWGVLIPCALCSLLTETRNESTIVPVIHDGFSAEAVSMGSHFEAFINKDVLRDLFINSLKLYH